VYLLIVDPFGNEEAQAIPIEETVVFVEYGLPG